MIYAIIQDGKIVGTSTTKPSIDGGSANIIIISESDYQKIRAGYLYSFSGEGENMTMTVSNILATEYQKEEIEKTISKEKGYNLWRIIVILLGKINNETWADDAFNDMKTEIDDLRHQYSVLFGDKTEE